MADYRLTDSAIVIRTADGAFIPDDPGNRDRAEYQAWIDAGGVPDPYIVPLAPVPTTISPRQFAQEAWSRDYMTYDEALAFAGAGTVPAALDVLLNQLPDEQGKFVRLFIVGSLSYERGHAATAAIGALWKLDSAGLDDFFRAAAAL